MTRVQIKLATDSTYFTFPINPIEFNSQDSYDYKVSTTVDGKSIEQYGFYDGRIRTMTWKNLPNKTPYAGDSSALLDKLRTLVKAGECHLLLNDLDKVGGTSARKSIKIIDISTSIDRGPSSATGCLKYTDIVISYVEILPES